MSLLTTHVGSLPRTKKIVDFIFARENNESFDQNAFNHALVQEVKETIRKQKEAGLGSTATPFISGLSQLLWRPFSDVVLHTLDFKLIFGPNPFWFGVPLFLHRVFGPWFSLMSGALHPPKPLFNYRKSILSAKYIKWDNIINHGFLIVGALWHQRYIFFPIGACDAWRMKRLSCLSGLSVRPGQAWHATLGA